MTVPPGGPYGQSPYGQDPYQGGPPPGAPYQGGPYQGGPPPGAPYQGAPYQGGPYQGGPPQPYPQAGQQFPPGWQGIPYPGGPPPAGPPPNGPRSKLPWIIGGAAVVVIALVIVLIVSLSGGSKTSKTAPSTAPSKGSSAPASPSPSGQQTATDCGPGSPGGDKPIGDTISAGKLSFPISATPGWQPLADDQSPNLIGAVGTVQIAPGTEQWMMQAEVGVTTFVPSMDVAAQASKLMQCVAAGPGYINNQPTLGPIRTSSTTVDGVKAARVDADITIADTTIGVKGDSVVIIAVDTKPVTIFLGASPIGDAASASVINAAIGALKVAKG